MDGDLKLTQSGAIMRYIARKHNLIGTTDSEITRIDFMENEIADFRTGWVRFCYNPDFVYLFILLKKRKKEFLICLGFQICDM